MASRIIAQLLVYGGGYVVRAFAEAYRQALANAGRNPGAAGATTSAFGRAKVTPDEARKILGLSSGAGLRDVLARYERMYHANEVAKGGSPYLQAKIAGARGVLVEEAR
eukprot:CAMPEP_0198329240 /NCGR_PEP_ID=MMETSP1450-20131203/16048_1 /TAXON_ID=753684 ORGANISM="Madagascaria erythrocladiodes, Strain CCMP3234" /NCGR_SAMPLE_ID=MMETSP1450 /ASSEMBLY_ACC=CAM_ASM_001115 /LENGTH=108 /DNA_ID=CAMNT_0044033441 /DNA_START=80 /DNA_END=403 /DNA_ORIENTATION=+